MNFTTDKFSTPIDADSIDPIERANRLSQRISQTLQRLPRRYCALPLRLMTSCNWPLDHFNRAIALRNLEFAYPDKPVTWRKRLARQSYHNALRNGADVLWLKDLAPHIHNARVVEDALTGGRGACLVTLHLGSWESLSVGLNQLGYPTTLLARIPSRYQYLRECYSRADIAFIQDRQPDTFIQIVRAIKNGRLVSFYSDGFADEVPVKLFGQPTAAPMGAITLANMLKVDVIIGWCWRESGDEYHCAFDTLPQTHTGNREADIQTNAQHMADRIEQLIRQYPEQWLWSLNRFPTNETSQGSC
ncbi:Lipid A biosynthesis lauroyltransferase [BD1-7 clade bacterium]|uniref:Lipid A biosynthesis lauroyltransferase n=1 Tax=BD1-7 clade bacterium TaxID=2029982 RepID=A0A5S9QBX5_9GAMM|nr:Lipid A biosynthesis lauroyltransferase [BD1-7 clade bacterium]